MTATAAPKYTATPDAQPNTLAYTFDGHSMVAVDIVANDGFQARVRTVRGWKIGNVYGISSDRLYRVSFDA